MLIEKLKVLYKYNKLLPYTITGFEDILKMKLNVKICLDKDECELSNSLYLPLTHFKGFQPLFHLASGLQTVAIKTIAQSVILSFGIFS